MVMLCMKGSFLLVINLHTLLFFAIDINEIDNLKKTVKGFGNSPTSLIKINPCDYLYGKSEFLNQIKKIYNDKNTNAIILVTVLKFLVPTFNPVNFYFYLDKEKNPIKILAEVNNTFGERHLYPLDGNDSFPFNGEHKKEFHVSPFNNMNGKYKFNFTYPGDNFKVDIVLSNNDKSIIEASLWGWRIYNNYNTLEKNSLSTIINFLHFSSYFISGHIT